MILHILVSWLITAISLFLVAKMNVGVEVPDFKAALWGAAVFGLVNGIIGPVLRFFAFPLTLLTFGLFSLVVNAGLLALTAYFSSSLKVGGFWSAVIGALLLSIFNALIFWLLPVSRA